MLDMVDREDKRLQKEFSVEDIFTRPASILVDELPANTSPYAVCLVSCLGVIGINDLIYRFPICGSYRATVFYLHQVLNLASREVARSTRPMCPWFVSLSFLVETACLGLITKSFIELFAMDPAVDSSSIHTIIALPLILTLHRLFKGATDQVNPAVVIAVVMNFLEDCYPGFTRYHRYAILFFLKMYVFLKVVIPDKLQ